MRYQTLADLQQAYASGALTYPVTLDNDATYAYPDAEGDAGEKVFDGGHPRELLEAALDLLGIPWEGV